MPTKIKPTSGFYSRAGNVGYRQCRHKAHAHTYLIFCVAHMMIRSNQRMSKRFLSHFRQHRAVACGVDCSHFLKCLPVLLVRRTQPLRHEALLSHHFFGLGGLQHRCHWRPLRPPSTTMGSSTETDSKIVEQHLCKGNWLT